MASPYPRGTATAPRPEPPVVPSRPSWRRRVLVGVAVLVVLVVALVAAGYGYARWRFDQVQKVHVGSLAAESGPAMNVLMVGSDSRAVAGNDAKAFGNTQQVAGQRADVIKVLHLVPGKGVARVLSIPRDLLVTMPGTQQKTRINYTFDKGPDTLVRAVEGVTGLRIQHYVLVNFEGFQGVVNALGGVKMYFPTPARDRYTGLDIATPGCHLLDGRAALAVARSRHYYYKQNGAWQYDGTSDFGRIIRQNAFLRAVVRSAHGIGLLHLGKLNSFLGQAVDQVVVDDRWSLGDFVSLGRHYRHFNADAMADYTFPTTAVNGYGSLGDVLLPKPSADKQVLAQLTAPATPPAKAAPAPKPSGPARSSGSSGAKPPAPTPAPSTPAFDPRPC